MSDNRDMLFLKIAVKNQLLSPEQAEQVLSAIESRQELGVKRSAGEVALEKEFLNEEQISAVEGVVRNSMPPEKIAGFEVMDRIGGGAVGTVYRAKQLSLDKIVALKVLHQSLSKHPKFVSQFIQEAKTVGRLNHPHIVHAIDAGKEDGYNYLAMEFVDGESLKDRIQSRGKLPEAETLALARAVTQALRHAHSNGLLHRDLKPDNILLGTDGQIKVADLGLAMPLNDAQIQAEEHKRMGTPFYLSPEQAQATGIDERSDLYALGATLYHCLVGKPLFTGKTVKEILTKQVHQEPVPPTEQGVTLSAATEALVLRLLAKDPGARYQSAEEVLRALQEAESSAAPTPRAAKRPAPKSRRPVAARAAARPATNQEQRTMRREAVVAEPAPRRIAMQKRRGMMTTFGGLGGVVMALILVVVAINRNSKPENSEEAREEAKIARLLDTDKEIIDKRRAEWRKAIKDKDKDVLEKITDIMTTATVDKDRKRGLQNLLDKNAISMSAPAIIEKLETIESSMRDSQMSKIDQFFTQAEQLRSQGKLWAAYKVIDEIPRKLQSSEEIETRIEDFIDDVSDEIDSKWAADQRKVEELRRDKEYRSALDILNRVADYADTDTASQAQYFIEEVTKQLRTFESTERGKIVQDEIKRYQRLVLDYRSGAKKRDFKSCISLALALKAEATTEAVRTKIDTDLEAFEMLENFVKDGVKHMIALGDEGKEVTIRQLDKRKVTGKARRMEPGRVWLEVSSGGGSAEVPIELTKITDETIFKMVEEKHGESSPAYLVPLGVLFTYRGSLSAAERHFDLAARGGFSPDTWLEKLEWIRKNDE